MKLFLYFLTAFLMSLLVTMLIGSFILSELRPKCDIDPLRSTQDKVMV